MEIEVDFSDVEILEEKLSKLGDDAEPTVNEVLHGMGVDTVTRDVTDLLPVSSRKKKHAKHSGLLPMNRNPNILTSVKVAKNKTSFGY